MINMMDAINSINKIPVKKCTLRVVHMSRKDLAIMNERRTKFVEFIKEHKKSNVADLANHLDCCIKNVRNDSEALVESGTIRKTKTKDNEVIFRMPF